MTASTQFTDEMAERVDSLEAAIRALVLVIGQLMEARRADREILDQILAACTRDGDSGIADALRKIAATLDTVAEDTRAVRDACAVCAPPA